MKRVEIWAIGRLKERGLSDLCQDYYRRCRRTAEVTDRELRDEAALLRALPSRGARGRIVALDSGGEALDSEGFAHRLARWLQRDPRVLFLIGGADGHSATLLERADQRLSLSPMTFAHRVARVVLAEQIYRAISIIEGSPYHRA